MHSRLLDFGSAHASAGYSTEAAQFFARITDPGTTRKDLYAAMIDGMVADGTWALTDCLYILAADIAGNALIELKSGTFNLTAVNSPAFVADQGYTSDGSTSYLNAAWDPATNGVQYAQNSAHIGVYARTAGSAAVSDVGLGTSNQVRVRMRSGTLGTTSLQQTGVLAGTSAVITAPAHAMGIRRVSTDQLYWRDGAQDATGGAVSLGLSSVDFNICRTNNAFSDRQIAAAHWGAKLDDTQAAAMYARLHTFMVAISADT